MLKLFSSQVDEVTFEGRRFFIKRDDLLHHDFSGNKARKLYHFLKADLSAYRAIVSHGSIQSNAMYSLSVLAKRKGLSFIYYADHIPKLLRENPKGNYRHALKNGMQLRIGKPEAGAGELFISEGGAVKEAQKGIALLAAEIEQWADHTGFANPNVFLPSGTGTTALYLQKYSRFAIHTCSCVGDDDYLHKQFSQLEQSGYPHIIKKRKKYHFGKLYPELYELWQKLKVQTGIEFDLLYDPIGWQTLLQSSLNDPVLYIHQGGVLGNETMLERYRYKYS